MNHSWVQRVDMGGWALVRHGVSPSLSESSAPGLVDALPIPKLFLGSAKQKKEATTDMQLSVLSVLSLLALPFTHVLNVCVCVCVRVCVCVCVCVCVRV